MTQVPEVKKLKNPIRFYVQLNEEQKQAKQVILANTITVLKGQAGSGKSMLAAQVALDMLFKKGLKCPQICSNMLKYAQNSKYATV